MSEKQKFQEILNQIRSDLKLLKENLFQELSRRVNPYSFNVDEKTRNWIFDVFLDELFAVHTKIVRTFEDFGLKDVNLPLLDIQTEAQNIAEGDRMSSNRVNLNILYRSLNNYAIAVDKAMSSVRKYMYTTQWMKMKNIKTENYIKPVQRSENGFNYDCFICHASEDKDSCVNELVEKLRRSGYNIWYDEFTLTLGDSLRRKIDYGLANSRFGIVVLSKYFFEKEWPQKELDGLVARERDGKKVIIPIWHNLTKKDVIRHSPILAGRLAASTNKGLDFVVEEIIKAINKS